MKSQEPEPDMKSQEPEPDRLLDTEPDKIPDTEPDKTPDTELGTCYIRTHRSRIHHNICVGV